MPYHVLPDQAGIVPVGDFDGLDLSRCFGTVLGASRHPDAPATTPVFIDLTPTYDGREVVDNNFSILGLKPVGVVGVLIDDSYRPRKPDIAGG